MAKYSRSSLSMKESLKEISSQRAEQFLNTFYFQYGHRSIADLAHVAFAVERLSLLAAIVLVDEQRWDGQERSTRYQNFRKSGWYMPDFGSDAASANLYRETVLVAARSDSKAGGDEARHLRAHAEGPGLRRGALPAAARDQHVAGADCECADPGNPGLAAAHQPGGRNSAAGRAPAGGRHWTGLECSRRRTGCTAEGDRRARSGARRACRGVADPRSQNRAHAREICRGQRLSGANTPGTAPGSGGTAAGRGDRTCTLGRPDRRCGFPRDRSGDHATLRAESLFLPADSAARHCVERGPAQRDHPPRPASSRTP